MIAVPQAAINLAKRFEGFHRVPRVDPGRAHPYVCPAGYWTIGYRHLCDLNLETAVVIAAKQRRSSVGAAFRAILATAEQFQTGERPPLNLFNRYSDLVRLAAVN